MEAYFIECDGGPVYVPLFGNGRLIVFNTMANATTFLNFFRANPEKYPKSIEAKIAALNKAAVLRFQEDRITEYLLNPINDILRDCDSGELQDLKLN